jgi:hypothetical protein
LCCLFATFLTDLISSKRRNERFGAHRKRSECVKKVPRKQSKRGHFTGNAPKCVQEKVSRKLK